MSLVLTGSVVLDIASTRLTAEDRELLLHPSVCGVILFSRNIDDDTQLTHLVSSIKTLREDLFVCVDQEGGRVQRCRTGFTRLPAMQAFHALYTEDPEKALTLCKDTGWLLASELLAVGIDFSFAPVLDLDDCHSTVIGDRAFSADPSIATALAGAFIQGLHEAGMCAIGKHFPGHGSIIADSHLELPVDNRSLEQIKQHDLLPFAALMAMLDGIMPAHIQFPQIDTLPAGFSARWLQDILRQELGFKGIIFSDDLTMAGAAFAGNYADRANAALQAGCNVIVVCNHRTGAEEILSFMTDNQVKPLCHELQCLLPPKKDLSTPALATHPRWVTTQRQLATLLTD